MQWPLFRWRRIASLALLGVVAAGCNPPPDDASPKAVEAQLAGTWLREYEEDGVKVRRVLVLQPGGQFQELARAAATGPESEHSHIGEWLFDGTNLKRRYTRMDGRQPASPMVPYATFEIRFASRNEFVGLDRVHKREVRYRRVDDGTLP